MTNIRGEVFGDIPSNEEGSQLPSKMNVIQRIMRNVTTPVLINMRKEPYPSEYRGSQLS